MGRPATAGTFALTVSSCEWLEATGARGSFAPQPPYPRFRASFHTRLTLMNRRVPTVGPAVLGTVGVFVYVNQADARAIGDQQPVTALVADRHLAAGTPAGQALADGGCCGP